MLVLVLLALSFISGVSYRLGGAARPGKWYDFLCNTKTRDVGCSLLTTVAINLQGHYPWWMSLIHFGLLWGALTTYWDFLNHKEEVWWTWVITGLGYGLCAGVYCFGGLLVGAWLLRCLVLACVSCLWRIGWKKDVVEEFGVGFMLTMSTVLL